MITPEGRHLLWELLTGASKDTLIGGQVRVSDGEQMSVAPIEHVTFSDETASADLLLEARFDGDTANHDWSRQEVVTAGGVVISVDEKDGGRKVQGMVWRVEVALSLQASSDGNV